MFVPDPGSKFIHPGSRIQGKKSTGFRIRNKECIFNTQKYFANLSEIWPRMSIPDPDPRYGFFSIPDPGIKKAPDPGSATLPDVVQGQQ
jgi:hypothetical protein